MQLKHKILILILLVSGIGLRFSLFWLNPPQNAFDNHYEPVALILQQGKIPEKDACWECNQPCLFYVGAAAVTDLGKRLGASSQQLMKICQFIPCLFGILTLPLILLILNKFPLSPFSRITAFGTVCFLPRHIYMSAMFTNDTISYFFVALCVYFLFTAIEKNFSLIWLLGLSVILTIAIFTKYTALVALPMVAIVFLLIFVLGYPISRKRSIALFVLVLLIPLSFLSPYMLSNYKKYNNPLPTNLDIKNLKLRLIPGSGIDYLSFKPWQVIKTPLISPDNVKSFWTVIYGRMWFDLEPKFLYFTDPDTRWWVDYHRSLAGSPGAFPDPKHLSSTTLLLGSSLITVGLIPTALGFMGFFYYLLRMKSLWQEGGEKKAKEGLMKFLALTMLFVVNAAGIIHHSLKFEYFSHMKAAFMLVSLSTFAVFLGTGVMALEKNKAAKLLIAISFTGLCLLVTLHIVDIDKALFLLTPSEKNRILMSLRYLKVF